MTLELTSAARRRLLLALGALGIGPAALAATPAERRRGRGAADNAYGPRPDVRDFALDVARRHGLPVDWTLGALAGARRLPVVQRLVMPPPPGQPKNWAAYRDRFVEPQRIAAGVAFWQQHAGWLASAEARWGVPAAIVVGIIGVETFYGRITGSFRVLDALATLAFDFPKGRSDRSAFFRSELEALLLLCRREGWDPAEPRGSYAGALGLPQFMPGSVLRHALDFDGDGRVDLLGSAADAIGSVANYLAAHGWQRGMATHYAVTPPEDAAERARLLGPDIVPSFDAAELLRAGARLDQAGRAHDGLLALVLLENGGAPPHHVAGTANFYALTRYNQSSYYALAVAELGEAVQAAR